MSMKIFRERERERNISKKESYSNIEQTEENPRGLERIAATAR